ncbi:MAG: sugar phosphate nucleotidyltransferase, partial [Candidatus Hodarchaeota archaeon]
PLGTAGGLALLREELKDTFLMINGDTLTTLNPSDLIKYHRDNGAISTIALKKREIDIDFGIAEIDGIDDIRTYVEKPKMHYLVSMGVYIFEPRVLEYIKADERLDFPDLIKILIAKSEIVKGFIYDGYWMDIGRPEDYQRANEEIEKIYPLLFE